ncbi:hypothetical protein F2P81_024077 [Scophthalmus maximus]|uniref:Uncharacterized protein n=1 Tax=Scophthalmus maximus TaxID=52904 RepID=A0A6A4RT14_SCOMX|nr:hypothetical protein F2P81_024077 [Scophthalmus maximus]
MRSTAELEIVREMKEKCCCVALNYEAELSRGGLSCGETHYTMPDGQIVTLCTERFSCICDKTSNLGFDSPFLHECCVDSSNVCRFTFRSSHVARDEVITAVKFHTNPKPAAAAVSDLSSEKPEVQTQLDLTSEEFESGIGAGVKPVAVAVPFGVAGSHLPEAKVDELEVTDCMTQEYIGHKLHMDQNEKLVMFGVTHVLAVDGFSKKIVSHSTMPVKNNLIIYEEVYRPAVLSYGLWDQVKVDCGREFYLMLFMQEKLAEYRQHLQSFSNCEQCQAGPHSHVASRGVLRISHPTSAYKMR